MQRLLIVDDDSDIRSMLTTYLVKQGFGVRAAGNGLEMRCECKRSEFDASASPIIKTVRAHGYVLAARATFE